MPKEAPKSLDDLVNEIAAQQSKADDGNLGVPEQPKAAPAGAPSRDQMLAELAERYGTSPAKVAEMLSVGFEAPVFIPRGGEKTEPGMAPVDGKPLVPIKLHRDYWAPDSIKDQWPAPGVNRIPGGTRIYIHGAEARRLIAAGVASRDDPMPDEM